MKENRSNWVKKDQLDTPLCEIFEDVRTTGTVRHYVTTAERILGLKPKRLDRMRYVEMNRYIDSLDEKIKAAAE
ncbi:hypothetical protein [Alkalihalophilus marmarensis]|nr:hypothetical protein [Alkalihalophilus marmarensis]